MTFQKEKITKFHNKVGIYRYLLDGGTVASYFPGNEITIRIVDEKFCHLNRDGEWEEYCLIVGNHHLWVPVNDSELVRSKFAIVS